MFLSSKRAVDESEVEAAERRSLRCVWVRGGRALTEKEAANEIVSEATLLFQQDLAQLGVQWEPGTLPSEDPADTRPDDPCRSSSGQSDSHKSNVSAGSSHTLSKTQTKRETVHEEEIKKPCESKRGIHNREVGLTEAKKDQKKAMVAVGDATGKHRVRIETGNKGPTERAAEAKPTNHTVAIVHCPENADHVEKQRGTETSEKAAAENESRRPEAGNGIPSEEVAPPKPEVVQTTKCPVLIRSLSQELAELVPSPLPLVKAPPQTPSSPMPPPHFRALALRKEEWQQQLSGSAEAVTEARASPARSGMVKHSLALSKVLQSIHAERNVCEGVQSVQQTPPSLDAASKSIQAPRQSSPLPPQMSTTTSTDSLHAGDIGGIPPGSLPASRNGQAAQVPVTGPSPISLAPPTLPLSPRAKQRRRREEEQVSSPELYADGAHGEEDATTTAVDTNKAEESFGFDSFELDSITERIMVDPVTGEAGGEGEELRELDEGRESRIQGGEELEENMDEGRHQPEVQNAYTGKTAHTSPMNGHHPKARSHVSPDNPCPKFYISLTDSQLERILDTSHQVSQFS